MTCMPPEAASSTGPAPDASDLAPERKPRRSSWRLLRRRDFRLYFLGSLGSNLGTWLQNTAQVLIAYQLTRSVFMVGVVVSAQFAGTLLVSPWAAVLAARIGSRRILVGTQYASAMIAGWMAWAYYHHLLGVHTLVLGALGLGLAFSLALPIQTALVPTLVDPADTGAAMAMNSVSYNSGRALAPALSVLVIAFIGPGLIFVLNAASFVIFAVALSLLGPAANAATHERPRQAHAADGLRVARRYRRILLLLAVVAAVTLADDPITVLSPGLAHTTLHVSTNWTGYFIAALGWGAVLGSLLPTAQRKGVSPSHASRRAAWSLLALALSVVVFTAGFSAPVSLVAALAAGMAALLTGAAAQNVIVGRRKAAASVAGLWAIAWAGTKPMASLLDGWLASHVGILLTGILLAFPAAALACCELTFSPERKKRIKKWSLNRYLESHYCPEWIPEKILSISEFILLRLEHIPAEMPSGGGLPSH